MESHPPAPDARRASALLADLEADRAALAQRAATPTWYLAALSVLSGLYVATPLLDAGRTTAFTVLTLAYVVIAGLYQQRRLVRPRRVGAAAGGVLAALLVVLLVLLSVSFGLVASGLGAWVALSAVVAAATAFALARRFDVLARRRASRVR
jgi:drug/metabolite transporter (DMT)-like permease